MRAAVYGRQAVNAAAAAGVRSGRFPAVSLAAESFKQAKCSGIFFSREEPVKHLSKNLLIRRGDGE